MNEFIEIQFRKDNERLRVRRQLPGGIEFDEPDPLERTVGVEFTPMDEIARIRMDSVRRIQGWQPGEFKLNLSVADGSIILRGATEHALPEGRYGVRLQVEEAYTPKRQVAVIDHDGSAVVQIDVQMDGRTVAVDLANADEDIAGLLGRSTIEGMSAPDWLRATNRRPTRQACLLNLMAALRTRPTQGEPLIRLVHDVFMVMNDRLYAKVDRKLLDALQLLSNDPKRPIYAEGPPHAPIHGRLLTDIPEPIDVKAQFKGLLSFRAEGSPSLQAVVAVPPASSPHTYVDFDLDLGNPLQDVAGFFVHMSELLDGKPTNHLDLRDRLARTPAGAFLYYTVEKEAPLAQIGTPRLRARRSGRQAG